jgi:myo-inositol-1(or 4)-monophosphatase
MLSPLNLVDRARAAAACAADYVRSSAQPDTSGWSAKGRHDFVTEVDRNAERLIGDSLMSGDDAGRIVGEELSPELARDGLVWVVDPLDGTTNFLHGYPAYAVSIAAVLDGMLQAGVVHHVPQGQVYWAARGAGAWCDDHRLRVSPITAPSLALIGTGFPFKDLSRLDEYQRQFARVAADTAGIRRAGSAALDLADVAAGRFEGFWEQQLSAWDVAAGTLLIREAGGVVTDAEGHELGIAHGSVVAGNPAIHQWLLETIRDRA